MNKLRRTILCVEDNVGDALLVETMLAEADVRRFELITVARLSDALALLV